MKTCYPKEKVAYYPKGSVAVFFQPGDFLLISDKTIFGRLIQFGQSLRFRNKRLARWNHAALIVNPGGELVEATSRGVGIVPMSKYTDVDYYVVHIDATNEDRHEEVNFALSNVNDSYGWVTILFIALSFLTGLKFSAGFSGQMTCSGLVARSLERTTAVFQEDTSSIPPGLLAKYYIHS